MSQHGPISRSQERCLIFLMAGASLESAAKRAGITPHTLQRWLARDPTFRRALAATRWRLVDQALAAIEGEIPHSVKTLAGLRDGEASSPEVRLAAASSLLQLSMKSDTAELERRLSVLERALMSRNGAGHVG